MQTSGGLNGLDGTTSIVHPRPNCQRALRFMSIACAVRQDARHAAFATKAAACFDTIGARRIRPFAATLERIEGRAEGFFYVGKLITWSTLPPRGRLNLPEPAV